MPSSINSPPAMPKMRKRLRFLSGSIVSCCAYAFTKSTASAKASFGSDVRFGNSDATGDLTLDLRWVGNEAQPYPSGPVGGPIAMRAS